MCSPKFVAVPFVIPAIRIDQTSVAIGLLSVAAVVAFAMVRHAKQRRGESRRKAAPSTIIETAIKQTLAKIAVSAALIVIIAVAIGRY